MIMNLQASSLGQSLFVVHGQNSSPGMHAAKGVSEERVMRTQDQGPSVKEVLAPWHEPALEFGSSMPSGVPIPDALSTLSLITVQTDEQNGWNGAKQRFAPAD